MILIGQYDSPFVRRAGIALRLYGIAFEHRPWSAFSDAGLIRRHNPLTRVPTLVLDDGEALIDSHCIIDYLDSLVPPERALFPRAEPQRRRALQAAALATGMADKAVSLFYEKRLHAEASEVWIVRCCGQIGETLAALERRLAARGRWFGEDMGHADIAAACAMRFVTDAHPGLVAQADYPAVAALCARLEAMPVFQEISQAFIPPA